MAPTIAQFLSSADHAGKNFAAAKQRRAPRDQAPESFNDPELAAKGGNNTRTLVETCSAGMSTQRIACRRSVSRPCVTTSENARMPEGNPRMEGIMVIAGRYDGGAAHARRAQAV